MKNPLNKRLPREFLRELGKYLVIFLFLAATIGFVSGFLVAGGSMLQTYNESFEKYHIEDGHFLLYEKADEEIIGEIEKNGVTLYSNFYCEEDTDYDLDGMMDSTLRIFAERDKVNQICLMKGQMPEKSEEIAIDRMYAENNDIALNDVIAVGGKQYKVTGYVALSDYSALFSDNGDMMFDAIKFGVAVVSEEGWKTLDNQRAFYCYSWKYQNPPADEIEEKEQSDVFMEHLAETVMLRDYVPRYCNQAIQFTGEDMGSDKAMMITLLYILIVILAFVFSITINHTIVKESAVIETLRASGYTKLEILQHYITNPMLITIFAAIIGNILGYTLFKNIVVKMYYGSYSLPTYETIWNGEAFILTTIVPVLIMLVTNVISIMRKLSLSPLKFIRRDLAKIKNSVRYGFRI